MPADRPTLIIAEGLSMYLRPEEGGELLRRITGHSSELERVNPAIRKAGRTDTGTDIRGADGGRTLSGYTLRRHT